MNSGPAGGPGQPPAGLQQQQQQPNVATVQSARDQHTVSIHDGFSSFGLFFLMLRIGDYCNESRNCRVKSYTAK